MPELPEVEVSRIGIAPLLEGSTILDVVVRDARLRLPVPPGLGKLLAGTRVGTIRRRGKYLLLPCLRGDRIAGHLLVHLGMSGSLRCVPAAAAPGKHDHVDLLFGSTGAPRALRLRDPRRFGLFCWLPGADPESHPLLAGLGVEPLAADFDGDWLKAALARRTQAIKPALMDASLLVGVGNIYAAESLFRAGISPRRRASRLSADSCRRLAAAIKDTLAEAIAAGGSSVRDYVHSDGGAGCFQLRCAVYDRAGQPCPVCAGPVRALRQAGRSTFYCPRCQR